MNTANAMTNNTIYCWQEYVVEAVIVRGLPVIGKSTWQRGNRAPVVKR
jgi:hypothetical protein